MSLIKAKQVKKSFINGQVETPVLNGIDLEIYHGEYIAIMGTSGSGKSTLLNILSGIDRASSGQIYFDDQDLNHLSNEDLADIRRLEMGFVFQQATMVKNLNILDNIILPASLRSKESIDSLREKANDLLKQFGIENLGHRSITEVSGGQLQRAGICRAILTKPKVIFADEPTGALNSQNTEEVLKVFDDIHQKGTTIVLVTHDAKAAAHAQKILLMKDGKIIHELAFNENESLENKQDFLNQKLMAYQI